MPESQPHDTGVILLAAGFSRRFGSVKLDALLANGQSLFTTSLNKILQTTDNIIVVVRSDLINTGTYQGAEAAGCSFVVSPDAADGMGHSLAAGMTAVPDHWQSVMICLADMPYICPKTFGQLFEQRHAENILIPVYQGQRGHPVLFGRRFFTQMANSDGDSGARHVVQANAGAVKLISVDDPGILRDIDQPSDLA